MTPELFIGTVQYLTVTLKSNAVIVDQPVEFSFDRQTWYPAEWATAPDVTRKCRILTEDVLPLPPSGGLKSVYVRLTDNPEIPIISPGQVIIQ